MAKKQTRRSISVSRTTYERLKAFCEANNISMSQFVETRVGDFLGATDLVAPRPMAPPPASLPVQRPSAPAIPMTSSAVRFVVEPPLPVIKKQEQPAPKPTEKRPDQIFTF
jgi:hypothetical protein